MPSPRILVVDDERFFRDLYREVLAARGLAVQVAASGEEAMAALAADRFDLLVTDLVMPGQPGLDLVRAARSLDPALEAVAVTADDELATAVQAMQAGCADFLVKPVREDDLAGAVERALERGRLRREHGRLLDENVDLVRAQGLFQQCLAILSTLDLGRLQDQILATLSGATDAQGAALWIADEQGALLLRAWRGVVDREALPGRLDPRADGLAAALARGAPWEVEGAARGEAFRLPLLAEGEPVGLALLERRARGAFGPEELGAAAGLARFAGVAVRNARRFQAVERLGLRDRETGAYHLPYFVDYAGKEFYKARRYGRGFSLAVLAVDEVDALRRVAGREALRAATRGLVAAVSRVVRDADILARVSEREYYVLLPETDHFGALMFARRAAEEIRREPAVRALDPRGPLRLALGTATFPRDGEDFEELLHACRARQEEQRGSLLRQVAPAGGEAAGFWELCDALLEGPPLPAGAPSARLAAEPELLEAVGREAAREIGRDPRARGVLYVGGALPVAAPVLAALPSAPPAGRAGDTGPQVYLLGPRGAGPAGAEDGAPHPLATQVFVEGDARLAEHAFLLFLTEGAAYGLVQGPGGRLFHTCDAPLVDALVARLQALYDLQPL